MEKLFNFINKSVSPFHAVNECVSLLEEAGFTKLNEKKTYMLESNKGYYVVRNDASIIAFVMPKAFTLGFSFPSTENYSLAEHINAANAFRNEVWGE